MEKEDWTATITLHRTLQSCERRLSACCHALLACMPISTHLNAGNNRACWLVSSKQTCSNNALYSLTRSTTTENVQPTHVILLYTTKRNGSRLFFVSAIRRSRSPFHIRWANGFAGKRTLSSSPRHRAPPRPVDASSSPKLVLSAFNRDIETRYVSPCWCMHAWEKKEQ